MRDDQDECDRLIGLALSAATLWAAAAYMVRFLYDLLT